MEKLLEKLIIIITMITLLFNNNNNNNNNNNDLYCTKNYFPIKEIKAKEVLKFQNEGN